MKLRIVETRHNQVSYHNLRPDGSQTTCQYTPVTLSLEVSHIIEMEDIEDTKLIDVFWPLGQNEYEVSAKTLSHSQLCELIDKGVVEYNDNEVEF